MKFEFSRRIGSFRADRRVLLLLILAGLVLAGRNWLEAHPGSNPWAPLDLRDPVGWATAGKLRDLRADPALCRATLERSGIEFEQLEPSGEGACRREDRLLLADYPLSARKPDTTCAAAVALVLWQRDAIDPLAEEVFGEKVSRIEHLGTYSCRRLYGRDEGPWSEHATANAIDIAGFVLEDGTSISVLADWDGEGDKQRFLRDVREGACATFSTVLSPDYNDAHRDHFHLDMSPRWSGLCR